MKRLVLVQPVGHRVWQWPAVVNLVMGGAGAGLFLTGLMADPGAAVGMGQVSSTGWQWLSPVLVLLGFSAVGFEAGRPLSARYLLHHLQSSWMSREVLAGCVFVAFSGLDALLPAFLFKVLAGLGAAALLLCQGAMVYCSKAVTAWNRKIVVVHTITSGMSLGFGLLLILTPVVGFESLHEVMGIGLTILCINMLVWVFCVFLERGKGFPEATSSLGHPKSVALIVGLGHLFPVLLLVMLLGMVSPSSESIILDMICILSGMTVALGGILQKGALILQANLFREIRADFCSVG